MNLHIPLGPAWEIVGPLPGPAAGKRKGGRGRPQGPRPQGLRTGGASTAYKGGQGGNGNIPPTAGTSSAPGSDPPRRFSGAAAPKLRGERRPPEQERSKGKSANPFTRSRCSGHGGHREAGGATSLLPSPPSPLRRRAQPAGRSSSAPPRPRAAAGPQSEVPSPGRAPGPRRQSLV